MTTTYISPADADRFDYVVVGGGTAGCVIGARLAEYLPHKRILLIEAGPSDFMDNRVLDLRQWLALLGGELDYDYPTTEQPMGTFFFLFLFVFFFLMEIDAVVVVQGTFKKRQSVICSPG